MPLRLNFERSEGQGQEAGMAVYQVLVKNLEGRTRCLRFSTEEIFCEDLKAELAVSEGVPGAWQRLVSGTRELLAGSSLVADASGFFPSCTLLLRLRGGKGGFGSLLRGAATKAGQKKTSNFDACRDMSGRRLRHVNAEKKLKEWKAEAKERELEKTAEEFLKKRRKVEEESSGIAVDLEKSRNDSLKAREQMASAVTDGLVEAQKLARDLKRKKVEAVDVDAKRPRLRLPGDSDLEDSEDEEEDSDGPSEEAGPFASEKDQAGPSHFEKMDASEAGTSGSSVDREDELRSFASDSDSIEASPSVASKEDCPSCSEKDEASDSVLSQEASVKEENISSGNLSKSVETLNPGVEIPGCGVEERPSVASKEGSPSCSEKDEASDSVLSQEASVKEENISNANLSESVETLYPVVEIPAGPLNLDDYNSSKDLEVLGLDRLKRELQNVGLKCGGNLQERAARLYLLKSTPLEKLDRKLFSKPPRK